MTGKPTEQHFVLCIRNDDSEDLERRKIYQVIPDAESEKEGYIRVQLPEEAEKMIVSAR